MSREQTLDGADKVAWFAIGVPLLCGTIILVLIFFSPDSAPARDRGAMLPIGLAAVTLAIVGAIFYGRWRVRKLARLELEDLAGKGVFPAAAVKRSATLTRISYAIADEFVLPAGSCALPISCPAVTAGQIADAVWSCVERMREHGELMLDPAAVEAACEAIRPAVNTIRLTMHTPLNSVAPMRMRHTLMRSLRKLSPLPLPPLSTPNWAITIAIVLALALTFGTTIPAAQWLDRTHPIEKPSPGVSLAAKFLVRGGFFVLLIVSAAGFGLIARWLFPSFPKTLRTVGHLAAYVDPPELRKAPSAAPWTKELVWNGVRTIVARFLKSSENNVHPTTRCDS